MSPPAISLHRHDDMAKELELELEMAQAVPGGLNRYHGEVAAGTAAGARERERGR